MKYTHLRRAAIGAAVIAVLACFVMLRNANREFSARDYTMLGGAIALVALNLGASYYMDVRNHQDNKLSGKF